jgi:hypothetical protein
MATAERCAACGGPQPLDARPGDLCVHCGRPARPELRCFWCAKWTPQAKFCRSCGAETVDAVLYGAARMLKDAGTDRFSIPKLLRELDRDQVENFSRIYQRHQTAALRHVEDLRFLERFLRSRDWSRALEDKLAAKMPFPEAELEALDQPVPAAEDDLARAKRIAASSPFNIARTLSGPVRLRLGDFDVVREVRSLAESSDPKLCFEAAWALTDWRVIAVCGRPERRALFAEILKDHPLRLAALDDKRPVPSDAELPPDPEAEFQAALLRGDGDRLRAALGGDELRRIVAARRLVQLGQYGGLAEAFRKGTPTFRLEFADSVSRMKEAVPHELLEALLEAVEGEEDPRLRELASRLPARQGPPEWALRIATASGGDRNVLQSLLQRPGAEAGSLEPLVRWMLEHGHFKSGQYGLEDAFKSGAVGDGFVPSVFAAAVDDDVRKDLLRMAEAQFKARHDESLHRFLVQTVFGPWSGKVRAAAWWVLHRGYREGGDYRGEGPLRIDVASGERFFGSTGDFLLRLAGVLGDRDSRDEVGLFDKLMQLFGEAEPAALEAAPKEGAQLVRAAVGLLNEDLKGSLNESLVKFLARVGDHPQWRAEALRGLEGMERKGGHWWDAAVRKLRLGALDLPDEPAWADLPADFVPSRWPGASAEQRAKLMEIAEAQLIHAEAARPALHRFLLRRGLEERNGELLRIRRQRDGRDLCLQRDRIEQEYGAFEDFVAAVVRGAEAEEFLAHPEFWDLLEDLLRNADEDAVAAAGKPFHDVLERLSKRERPDPRRADLKRAAADLLKKADPERFRPPEAPEEEKINPAVREAQRKQEEAQRLGTELQAAILALMHGPASPEAKMKEAQRLQTEFQAEIRRLYGA